MVPNSILAWFLFFTSTCALQIESGSLKTEGLIAPRGISVTTPRLTWRLSSSTRGDKQTAYQIQVATSFSKLGTKPDLWDSGKVTSPSNAVLYGGRTLKSRDLAFWRVRSYDFQGRASAWSAVTTFELALLKQSDWTASWIGNPNYSTGHTSLPLLASHFGLDKTCSKISKARLYIIGLGQCRTYINGKAVEDDVLTPGYSNWNKTLLYSTYDVQSFLRSGNNAIGVELGKGMYDAEVTVDGRYYKLHVDPQQLMVRAQLEYACSDGKLRTFTSSTSWKSYLKGPTLESSWYGGEEYDSRKEVPNWTTPSDDISKWNPVEVVTPPTGSLTTPQYPPLKITETIPAVAVLGPVNGSYIFDFGTQFAGWFTLSINEPAGTRITMWPAEVLHSNGAIDQTTYGGNVYDGFTSSGKKATYHPKFIYHGMRYLAVNFTYAPKTSDASALVIRANNKKVGSYTGSDSILNSIYKITDRAIKGNTYSMFTDCPQREKLGWLEQDQLVFDPVARGYDIEAHGHQVELNMKDGQTVDGLVPDIVPEYTFFPFGYRDDPNWGNTVVLFALYHYQFYGDLRILQDYYDTMQKYVNYLTAKATNYTLSYGLGDWITFDNTTPKMVTATFGWFRAVQGMIRVAKALGKTSDVQTYTTLLKNIGDGFNAALFHPQNATYGSGSQACNAIPLDMGIVPAECEEKVLATLIASVRAKDNHLTVGEIALPSLIDTLKAHNRSDVVYDMVTNPTSPSYAYQVLTGATALTERWDGSTEGGSQDHFMLGYGDRWIYETAGLKQSAGSVAWNSIDFYPDFVGNMTSASASYRSIKGLAEASWTKSASGLTYKITVPVGSSGTVTLPGYKTISESGVNLLGRKLPSGISSARAVSGGIVVKVGSGKYSFSAE